MSRAKRIRRMQQIGLTAALSGGLFAGGFAVASAATGTATTPGSPTSQASPSSPSGSHTPPAGAAGANMAPGVGGALGARRGPGARGGPGGVVTALTSTSLTIEGPRGTAHTFTLNAQTTYAKDGSKASFSDLALGEEVTVRPTAPPSSPTSTSPLVAGTVAIHSPRVSGVVKSVSGSSGSLTIVVADRQGFWRTIVTSASTTFSDKGSAVTNPAITAGEFVSALGAIDANHTSLDASAVVIGLPPARKPPAGTSTAPLNQGSSTSSPLGGTPTAHPGGPGPGRGGFGGPGMPGGLAAPSGSGSSTGT